MAYLTDTVLTEYRQKYDESKLDAHDHRLSNYGILAAFQDDTPNLIQASALEENRTSEDRATKIPVIKRKDFSGTRATTRSCTAIENYNTSALVTASWTTYANGFHMIPSQYKNNDIGYMADFTRKMNDLQRDALVFLDGLSYTKLNTDKSVVNNAEDNPYALDSDTMTIPNADKSLLFNELEQIMKQNDLPADRIVASPRFNALVNELSNQGVSNEKNYAFQFGGYNLYYSNRVTVDALYRDTFFVMPNGSMGFMTWVDPDSKANETSLSGKEWRKVNMPLLGFDVGLLHQDACADNSTEIGGGAEASKTEYFSFSFDYSFLTAYNSDSATLPGSIFKGRIMST